MAAFWAAGMAVALAEYRRWPTRRRNAAAHWIVGHPGRTRVGLVAIAQMRPWTIQCRQPVEPLWVESLVLIIAASFGHVPTI